VSAGLRVVIEADGGSRGNPGPAGYGAVVRDAATGAVLAERSESIGVATNNVAEYQGLIAGLTAAAELGATVVEARLDSKLVVEQMAGRWQIKNAGLRPLATEAAALVRRFDSVTFGWIPRERNKHADALANAAMDRAAGKPPKAAPAPEAPRQVAAVDSPARAEARAAAARASARTATAEEPATGTGSWTPRPASTATRLVLVRHGETDRTAQRRYSGRGDAALTDRGVAQAKAAARRVAQLAPDAAAVVSSPLSRCTGTAATIAAALGGRPVLHDEELIECDFGVWEGLTFAEVQAQWPQEMTDWLASPEVAPPKGESFVQVGERVRHALRRLVEAYPAETVVVVSHVSPIKLLLRDALAAGDGFLHRLFLDPAGISVVDFWPDDQVAVRTVNDTAHLAGL